MAGIGNRMGRAALIVAALAVTSGAFAQAKDAAVCFEGSFVGYDIAKTYTTAALFSGQSFPVMGRFTPRDGAQQQAAALSLKIALGDRVGVALSATAGPDDPPAGGFASARYQGDQRLRLTSERGKIRIMRWALEPIAAAPLAASLSGNLALELVRQATAAPLTFDFTISLMSNRAIPAGRALADSGIRPAGRLTITAAKLRPLPVGCPDWAFEATRLPDGFDLVDEPRPPADGSQPAPSRQATPDTR